MIFDIDNKNMIYKFMNILQLKWILYNLIQKKRCKKIFEIIKNIIKMIIKKFIR